MSQSNEDRGFEAKLLKYALRLREVDKLFLKSFAGDRKDIPKLLVEFGDLKKSIKILLLDRPVITIHDRVAEEVINKIKSEEDFETERIVKIWETYTKEKFNLSELDYDDMDDLSNDLYSSWFSQYDYIENLYEIGSLMLRVTVPDILKEFVAEARRCYAFEQYNAVFSLSRTILEISLRDLCMRKGLIRKGVNRVTYLEKHKVKDLIDKTFSGKLRENIWGIYNRTSYLIHGNKTVTAGEAKSTLIDTLKTIERAYKAKGY